LGDFPPNSRVTLFKFEIPALAIISCPTSVLPVKATLSINGCLTIAYPTSPNPGRTLITPSGNPASRAS